MTTIYDDIGEVVASLMDVTIIDSNAKGYGAPYYMFGHRREISNRVSNKTKDSIAKFQKFPLIALRLDIKEQHDKTAVKMFLNIAIITNTSAGLNAEQRLEQVFKPILYPLYKNFLAKIKVYKNFLILDSFEPTHEKYDRMFWGKAAEEGNLENLFAEPIDAIELINLEVSKRIKC